MDILVVGLDAGLAFTLRGVDTGLDVGFVILLRIDRYLILVWLRGGLFLLCMDYMLMLA